MCTEWYPEVTHTILGLIFWLVFHAFLQLSMIRGACAEEFPDGHVPLFLSFSFLLRDELTSKDV